MKNITILFLIDRVAHAPRRLIILCERGRLFRRLRAERLCKNQCHQKKIKEALCG